VRQTELRVQQPQVVRDLGDGRHRGVWTRARGALLERNRGRHADHLIDVRARHGR
jgi:hypothetical protein